MQTEKFRDRETKKNKTKPRRDRDGEDRERDKGEDRKIKRGREMEREQGKGRQRLSETQKEIKTAGMKKVRQRSLLFSSLSSLVSPGFGPPLLFFGFHSNREGSTKFAYTFTSFLSA